jgi:hypothetical protein
MVVTPAIPPHPDLGALLKKLRNRASRRVIADAAGVNVSVVSRAERGQDCLLSTWKKLFDALGYRLQIKAVEYHSDATEMNTEESGERQGRRLQGLEAGWWR